MSNYTSNYTLTTDLIADCMALIPHNLQLLNESQEYYSISDNIFEGGMPLFVFESHKKREVYFGLQDWDMLEDYQQYLVLSHCLLTISEFKEPNPKRLYTISKRSNSVTLMVGCYEYYEGVLENLPKTIGKATLHGNGTFPQTLKELCESYKNVMEK